MRRGGGAVSVCGTVRYLGISTCIILHGCLKMLSPGAGGEGHALK